MRHTPEGYGTDTPAAALELLRAGLRRKSQEESYGLGNV